jgi:hypothetical protein
VNKVTDKITGNVLHSEENKMTSQLVKNNDSGKAQI